METNININDLPEWLQKRIKEKQINKFVEFGKLGGRPKKEIKKSPYN